MQEREARRVTRELSDVEKERLEALRGEIAQELPELQARERARKEAREEATLSGELRRSIAQSDLSLTEVAHKTGIAPSLLDEFLTGERTLRSDVMDRLANVLGYAWSKAK